MIPIIRILSNINQSSQPIPKYSATIDLLELGHPTHLLSSFQLQNSFYYNNKTYINWMKRDGVSYANENMVMWFDHQTKSVSDSYSTGIVNASSADLHSHGSIFVTSTGRIIVVRVDENNTRYYLSYSTDGINWTDTIEIGTATVNNYAQFYEFGGTIYLISRNGDSPITNKYAILYKSTDDGLTWDTGVRFVQLDADQRVYPGTNTTNKGNEIVFIFSRRNDALGGVTFPSNYVLRSTDGDTWENWQQTWSKTISTEGIITQSELEANAESDGTTDVINNNRWCVASAISDAGNIYMIQLNDSTGFNFVYYNAGWQKVAIGNDLSLTGSPFGLVSLSEDSFILYAVNNSDELIKLTTTNKGVSWTLSETIKTGVYERACIPVNYTNKGVLISMVQDVSLNFSNLYIKEL